MATQPFTLPLTRQQHNILAGGLVGSGTVRSALGHPGRGKTTHERARLKSPSRLALALSRLDQHAATATDSCGGNRASTAVRSSPVTRSICQKTVREPKQPRADPRREQIRAEQPEKPRDPRAARPEVQPKPPAPCMPHACPCERLAQSEVAQSLAEAKTSSLSDPVSLSPRSWCCKPIRRSEGADATPLCRSLSVEPPHRPAPACRNDARIRSAREMGRTAGKGTQHG